MNLLGSHPCLRRRYLRPESAPIREAREASISLAYAYTSAAPMPKFAVSLPFKVSSPCRSSREFPMQQAQETCTC
jgi:hypothetical protein